MIETIPFETARYPTLTYSRKPFPAVVLDGKPWWSTAHVQDALGYGFDPYECEVFTPLHVGAHRFDFDAEDEMSHVVSTLAAQQLAEKRPDRRANRMLGGWLRKREQEFRTAEPEQPGTLFVVREEGPHPVRPFYPSAAGDEWVIWNAEHKARFAPPAPLATSRPAAVGRMPVPPFTPPPPPPLGIERA